MGQRALRRRAHALVGVFEFGGKRGDRPRIANLVQRPHGREPQEHYELQKSATGDSLNRRGMGS